MAVTKGLAEDPYERLANGIIMQAVSDYRAAIKKVLKNQQNQNALHDVMEIEKFFRSQWYQALTGVDGEYLIRRLRKEAKEKMEVGA